jgi:hypothetical protein
VQQRRCALKCVGTIRKCHSVSSGIGTFVALGKNSLLDLPFVDRCQILGILLLLLLLLLLFICFIASCARLLLCCHSFCVCLFPCLCPPSPLLPPLLLKVHSCFPWPKVHLVIVMSVSLLSQVR